MESARALGWLAAAATGSPPQDAYAHCGLQALELLARLSPPISPRETVELGRSQAQAVERSQAR